MNEKSLLPVENEKSLLEKHNISVKKKCTLPVGVHPVGILAKMANDNLTPISIFNTRSIQLSTYNVARYYMYIPSMTLTSLCLSYILEEKMSISGFEHVTET